jgi:hypothetical protein
MSMERPKSAAIPIDPRFPSLSRPSAAERIIEEHGEAKLPDLLATLADCKRARDGGVYDRCRAVYDEASRLHSSPSARRRITSE